MSASKLESDTDVSSNDSWTVLEKVSNKSSFTKLEPDSKSDTSVEQIEPPEDELDPPTIVEAHPQENETEDRPKVEPSQSVLEELDQKSVTDKQYAQFKNKKRLKINKPAAFLSIMASFLTITGLTLFCLMYPSKTNTTESLIDKIENNYIDIMTNTNINKENVINSLQKTMETLNLVQEVKIIDEIAKDISSNKKLDENKAEKQSKHILEPIVQKVQFPKTSKNAVPAEAEKNGLISNDNERKSEKILNNPKLEEIDKKITKLDNSNQKNSFLKNENKYDFKRHTNLKTTKSNTEEKFNKYSIKNETETFKSHANSNISQMRKEPSKNYFTQSNFIGQTSRNQNPTCHKDQDQKFKYYLDKISSFTKKIPNKFSVGAIARFLSDHNVHLLLTALVQDICIYKLITQICKNGKPEKKLIKKISKVQKLGDGKKSGNKLLKKVIKRAEKSEPLKKLNPLLPSAKSKSQCIISKSLNNGFCNKTVSDRLLKPNFSFSNSYVEYGKSECQKRFEDLEKKWEHIGATNRQIISNIRNSFQNEIDEIKDSDQEVSSRQQKIIITREKYTERLKTNREKYLRELGKLRDERQRILKQLCLSKKKLANSSKDVSVGNYAVILPRCYDFQQKLKVLKEQEDNTALSENINEKALSIASSINSTPELTNNSYSTVFNNYTSAVPLKCVESEYTMDRSRDTCDEIEDKILYEENKKRLNKLRQKFLRRRAKFVKKVDRAKESDSNISSNRTTSESAIDESKSNTMNELQKSRDLYSLLFEKYAKVVKNNDSIKWNTKYNKDIFRKIIKQDSLKAKDNRLIYRGSHNSTY